jgi:uncharacterized protein (DUF433 family)
MTSRTLDSHIEATPGVMGGKPRIAGRRITVEDIAVWHVRMGQSVQEIASEYDLTPGDVHAALAYYFDHRAEIDEAMRKGEEAIEKLRQETPSLLRQKLQAGEQHGGDDQVLHG